MTQPSPMSSTSGPMNGSTSTRLPTAAMRASMTANASAVGCDSSTVRTVPWMKAGHDAAVADVEHLGPDERLDVDSASDGGHASVYDGQRLRGGLRLVDRQDGPVDEGRA